MPVIMKGHPTGLPRPPVPYTPMARPSEVAKEKKERRVGLQPPAGPRGASYKKKATAQRRENKKCGHCSNFSGPYFACERCRERINQSRRKK